MALAEKITEKTENKEIYIKNPAIIAGSSIVIFALASIGSTMLAISILIISGLIAFCYFFQKEKEEAEIRLFVVVMLTAVSLAAIKLYFLSDVIGEFLK